jgi:6-phosphogluconolactonase
MTGVAGAETDARIGKPPARSPRRLRSIGAAVVAVALLGVAQPAAAERLLFVSNGDSNNVSAFRIGSTGALTAVSGSPFATGTFPQGLTVRMQRTPGGVSPAMVFVANFSTNNVSAFTVGSGGRLTAVPGSPFATGQGPMTPVVSPEGSRLYVANHVDTPGSVSAFVIQADGALVPIAGSPFSTGGNSPWGIAVSRDHVLYVPNENSGSVAVMRIGTGGGLTHVPGSPFVVGEPADQLTDADVSIDGRFLFVTAGLGNNRGVWSFALRQDGGLSSVTPITRAPTPIPVHVLVAPNNRHVYVTSRNDANFGEGAGGVSGFTIGSNGSLSRIFGASPSTTPFRTGGTTPFATDMLRIGPPRRLYVGHGDSDNVGAFSVNDSTGTLSSIGGSPFATGGAKPNHFSVATTITDAAVVRRSGSELLYRAAPGQANKLALSAGAIKAFADDPGRSTTPAPSSGCMPITDIRVECFTSGVTAVRLVLEDRDDSLNANNGVPEIINCGTGFDSLTLDLTDPEPLFNTCESVSRFPVDTGSPATVVGRSARASRAPPAGRLRCRRGREGGRCRGRLALRLRGRRRAGRVIGRARYSIRAGRRETVRVPLRIRISGRRRVRLVARERARDGRPMTTRAVLILRG